MSMIGHTLFQIGSLICVSPSAMGLETTQARELGLGGYYIVDKMTGKIDSGGWTIDVGTQNVATTIADVLEGSREGEQAPVKGTNEKPPDIPASSNPETPDLTPGADLL